MPIDSAESASGTHAERWGLAERLLRVPDDYSLAERPEEFLERVAAALAEALAAEAVVRWFDVEPQPAAPLSPHWLRLLVNQHDAPYAALDLLRQEPFDDGVQRLAGHLANDLTYIVDAITVRSVRMALGELREAMITDADLEGITASATDIAVRHLGAEAGLLLLRKADAFSPLAVVGEWPEAPEQAGWLLEVAATGIAGPGAMGHEEGFVTVPIATSRPARCVLVLRFSPSRPKHSVTFPVISEMASAAAPFLDARWRDRVLNELLELNRASEETSSTEMYGRVLQTALRLVPGVDSGTLLARATPDEPFAYQAASGFDLRLLRRHPVAEEEARAWYGPDERGWRLGLPRIISRNDIDIEQFGGATAPHLDPAATSYDKIQASLCLPVLRDGEVMAILNLDNLSDPSGLGRDSSQLAYLFGAPLASLLHRQQTRDLLSKAALTDELTGLDNRRAFDANLRRELARAARGGVGPSVMLMDLKGFKEINDRFGHDVGDQALVAVAHALQTSLRASDMPARRGGDEFVALLVDTPPADAAAIGERVKEAVAGLVIGDVHLRINVGTASMERDGNDPGRLLRLADERMYLDKLGPR